MTRYRHFMGTVQDCHGIVVCKRCGGACVYMLDGLMECAGCGNRAWWSRQFKDFFLASIPGRKLSRDETKEIREALK